jgi:hypothetical protein
MRLRKDVLWKHRASRRVALLVKRHWEKASLNRKKKLAKEAQDRGSSVCLDQSRLSTNNKCVCGDSGETAAAEEIE